jgi:hypothetical protein
MSGRIWAITAFASVFALLHCGGTVEIAGDGGGFSGASGHGSVGSAAGSAAAGGSSVPLDAALDEYTGPGCPEAGPPVELTECDPFAAISTCDPGQGCFPFVDHPNGDGCGAQSFGTECLKAGTGTQGATCGDGVTRCAAGFVCVVGSQPGEHCVQLCRMGVQNQCPAGLICGELDVEGYGVCS